MNSYHLLYTEENKNLNYKLSIYYKDALGFGPHEIRAVAEMENEEPHIILNDKIQNDGSNLSKNNAEIEWLSNGAKLSMRGSQQDTKIYIIKRKGVEEYEIELVSD